MLDYFRNCSSNAHQVCCEDSPTKGLYDHCQSDDLDLHSRSQVRLKFDYFLTCNMSDNITKKLSYYMQTWHAGRLMHGVDLYRDFENVCTACLSRLFLFCTVLVFLFFFSLFYCFFRYFVFFLSVCFRGYLMEWGGRGGDANLALEKCSAPALMRMIRAGVNIVKAGLLLCTLVNTVSLN